MKKILTLSALALCLALSERQADAWVNSKFGIGLNWNWQSGGNNFLWGFFRNGQPPGPCCDGFGPGGPGCLPGGPGGLPYGPGPYGPGYGYGYGANHGSFPFPPAGAIYGPQDFQYFGRNPNAQPNNTAEMNQQQPVAAPTNFRTAAYYPYQHGYQYYPVNGNSYNPYAYSFGVNIGR